MGIVRTWLFICLTACSFERTIPTTDPVDIDAPLPTPECPTGYMGDGITCTPIDACATSNGGCPAACESTGPGTRVCYVPRTCAEVAAHKPVPDNSSVTLYAAADPTKPWTAYCHTGVEYLSAANPTTNYGQYTAGNKSPGTNVRTTYARMRIDPMTLQIDVCDRVFTTSTGSLSHDPAFNDPDIPVSSMPLGAAMDCGGNGSQNGVAAIDLSGTPFVVTSDWSRGGNGNAGNTNKSGGGRAVSITGGGNCGWNAPIGSPNNPFNTCTSLKVIALQYSP